MPFALARKCPKAAGEWRWQLVIRTVQELLGHSDVKMMMICTHVMQKGAKGAKGAKGVKSPLDRGG